MSYEIQKYFLRENKMASHQGKKFKKLHSLAEFQAFQDQIAKIEQQIREIREGMTAAKMSELEIMSGTFTLLIERMHSITSDWKSAFAKQSAVRAMKDAREAMKNNKNEKR